MTVKVTEICEYIKLGCFVSALTLSESCSTLAEYLSRHNKQTNIDSNTTQSLQDGKGPLIMALDFRAKPKFLDSSWPLHSIYEWSRVLITRY